MDELVGKSLEKRPDIKFVEAKSIMNVLRVCDTILNQTVCDPDLDNSLSEMYNRLSEFIHPNFLSHSSIFKGTWQIDTEPKFTHTEIKNNIFSFYANVTTILQNMLVDYLDFIDDNLPELKGADL